MILKWRQDAVRGSCLFFSLLVLLGCSSHIRNPSDFKLESGSTQSPSPMLISLGEIERTADGMQVALIGAQPFSYRMANHDQPLHLTIDIPQTRIEQPVTRMIDRDGIQKVELSQVADAPDMTRLKVYLDDSAAYSVAKEQERVFVRVRPDVASGTTSTPAQAQMLAALPGRSVPYSGATATRLARPAATEYRAGPGDVLDITVYDEPDLTRHVKISERGQLAFPLIGLVQVKGLTVPQIVARLESRLSPRYLLHPQVFVDVAEFASKKVFISGAVRKPIVFNMEGETTLLEVLSLVKDPANVNFTIIDLSNISSLTVFRRRAAPDGQPGTDQEAMQAIHIDLDRLVRQGDMSLDIVLQSHDVIYLPKPDSVFVFGEVLKTGPVLLTQGQMPLIEAVNKAGGFAEFAAPKRTRVLRMVDGKEQVIYVDMAAVIRGDLGKDILLKANDIVIVPETLF